MVTTRSKLDRGHRHCALPRFRSRPSVGLRDLFPPGYGDNLSAPRCGARGAHGYHEWRSRTPERPGRAWSMPQQRHIRNGARRPFATVLSPSRCGNRRADNGRTGHGDRGGGAGAPLGRPSAPPPPPGPCASPGGSDTPFPGPTGPRRARRPARRKGAATHNRPRPSRPDSASVPDLPRAYAKRLKRCVSCRR